MTQLINDSDTFPRIFSSARSSAFKLEVRRAYGVPEEDEPFQEFLAGRDPGIEWLRPWLDLMRETTGRGVRVERVRVVDEPPSDYLRFEISITPHNIAAGEDIRYINRRVAEDLNLPAQDYWVIDSHTAYLAHFTEDDRYLGLEKISDPERVAKYIEHGRRAWQNAALLAEPSTADR